MKIAFAGVFAGHVADRVRARLRIPCEVTLTDDRDVGPHLGDIDVLVSMAFTREMAAAAPRLRLVQVPGAGLDRIDRAALAPGTALANAYGHDVGIAEYVIGAMLAVTRSFCRIDADLRRGQWDSVWSGAPVPLWLELAGKSLGILGYGRIGQAVARRALAFDMDVLAIAATRAGPIRTASRSSAVRPRSTRCSSAPTTWPSRSPSHPRPAGSSGPASSRAEAHRGARQRGARRDRGRGRALRRASSRCDRGGRARRLVPVPGRRRAGPSRPPPVPRAAQCADDTPRVGLDGRHDGRRAGVIAENIHRAARGEAPVNLVR